MKKKSIIVVAALIAVLMLFMLIQGCSTGITAGKSETAAQETTAAAQKSTAKGEQWFAEMTQKYKGETLNVLVTSGYGFVEALQMSGAEFERVTGVKINVTDLPWDQMHDKVMANFIGKSAEYDVVNMDGWQVPAFFSAGAITKLQPMIDQGDLVYPDWDINDFIKNDFKFNGTWPAGGEIYAIPYFPDVIMLFYNTVYFKANNLQVPKTWDEYKTIGEALKGKDLNSDGKPDYAVGMFAKKGPDLPTLWHDRFLSFGGDYFDEDLKPLFNSDAAVQGLDMLVDHLKFAAPGSLDWDVPMLSKAFVAGDIAMCEMWTNLPSLANDAKESKVVGEWSAAPIPMGKRNAPQYGGWSLGIPAFSAKQELAFLFMQWTTSKEIMKKTVLERGIPQSRYSVLQDPDVLKMFPWYTELVKGLDVGEAIPKIPEAMEVYAMIEKHLSNTLSGAASSKESLDFLQDEVTQFMTERGYYE